MMPAILAPTPQPLQPQATVRVGLFWCSILVFSVLHLGCESALEIYPLPKTDTAIDEDEVDVQDVSVPDTETSLCGGSCGAGVESCCPLPDDETLGVCIPTSQFVNDANHCGGCNVVCPDVTTCQSGTCKCAEVGQDVCENADGSFVCVDPDVGLEDEGIIGHCGACGNDCGLGEVCVWGECFPPCPGEGDEPIATQHTCGSDEHCFSTPGTFEPGSTISWAVGPDAEISAGTYTDVGVHVQLCHGGWNNPSMAEEHGLVWLSIGSADTPDPAQTLSDVYASPCTAPGACASPTIRSSYDWNGVKASADAGNVELRAGEHYAISGEFSSYYVDVTLRNGSGSLVGDLSMRTDESSLSLAEGQGIHVTVGWGGAGATRPLLNGWKFYNPTLHLVPLPCPPGGC